jgi:hypothetical protein
MPGTTCSQRLGMANPLAADQRRLHTIPLGKSQRRTLKKESDPAHCWLYDGGTTYHPIIVIGCAIVKRTRRVILRSKKTFEMRAMTSWMALTMVSLSSTVSGWPSRTMLGTGLQGSHQAGSDMNAASWTFPPGTNRCRHGRTKAHILKAEAVGPRVPAIMGKADEANHHRLQESIQ